MLGVQYTVAQEDSLLIYSPKGKDNYWNRLVNGHVDRTFERTLDVSFAGAPSYTREAGFGVGGMATGLYRVDRTDSIMSPSDVTLVFNASLNGFYSLEARGNHYFRGRKTLLSYEVGFNQSALDFWGVTYEDCAVNPAIAYTRQRYRVDANYQYKVHDSFSIGATVDFSYIKASKIDSVEYLNGERRDYLATGLGVSLQYDTRDFIPNPRQGVYLMLRQSVFPKGLGTCGETLYRTTVVADAYRKLWKGSVLAVDLYGQFNSDGSPWTMREWLGGNQRMRGYYTGRYIDNNIVSGQVEIRQHVYRRWGFTAWAGGGTVFPSFDKFDWGNILPNYGIGLRFEVKHNVNARIDYGFGKHPGGFVFNIGEAF